jgi:hypothetical protein
MICGPDRARVTMLPTAGRNCADVPIPATLIVVASGCRMSAANVLLTWLRAVTVPAT